MAPLGFWTNITVSADNKDGLLPVLRPFHGADSAARDASRRTREPSKTDPSFKNLRKQGNESAFVCVFCRGR